MSPRDANSLDESGRQQLDEEKKRHYEAIRGMSADDAERFAAELSAHVSRLEAIFVEDARRQRRRRRAEVREESAGYAGPGWPGVPADGISESPGAHWLSGPG